MKPKLAGWSGRQATYALFLALILAMSAMPAAAGEEITVDGTLHIRNPAKPPGGIRTVELREIWRVGDSDDDLLLGLPTGLDYDAAGNIYVLDAQLNQIHVIAPDGRLIDTRGREGDGPGEMRNPSDLIVWPDGTTGVVQEFPGYVIRLDKNGDPLPSLHPGGATEDGGWGVLMNGRARGETFVLCGQMTKMNDQGVRTARQYLAAYDADGKERFAYVEVLREGDGGRPDSEEGMLRPDIFGWDLAPDGRLVYPMSWKDYALRVCGPDGKCERVIEREFEPRKRVKADKDYMLRLMGVPEGVPAPFKLSDYEPTVALLQRGLQVTDTGEIWVLTSRGNRDLPDGVLARLDVFDPQGHFVYQVDVKCQGDPLNDRLAVLPDGRMIRQRRFVDALITSLGPGSLPEDTREDEEATPAVICYEMVWK